MNLADITEETLILWCQEGRRESPTLDFKRIPPGKEESAKREDAKAELAKDVCAFANADGGDLVFGVAEKAGVAKAIVPITDPHPDALERQIRQTLESRVEPRLTGIAFHPVKVEGGYVLVVRVPASFDGPHCDRIDGKRRFVVRNGTGTSDMTFEQLRRAFDRSASLVERADSFVQTRRERLAANAGTRSLQDGPISALHLVPLATFSGRAQVDIRDIHDGARDTLAARKWLRGGGTRRAFNLEGVAVFPSPDSGKHEGYVQVFRQGAMEAAWVAGGSLPRSAGRDAEPLIPGRWVVNRARQTLSQFLDVSRDQGLAGPAVVGLSLLNVGLFRLSVEFRWNDEPVSADRDRFELPLGWIEDLAEADVDAILASHFDVLWQGFGLPRCDYFDSESGAYLPEAGR